MCSPYGLAFDSSGNLWVASEGSSLVLQYPASSLTANGPAADLVLGSTSLTSATCSGYPSSALAGNCLGDIRELALNPSGSLFVSDYSSEGLDLFSPTFSSGMNGGLALGGQGCHSLANTTCGPDGVAFDKQGNLWVADYDLGRVMEFTPPFFPGEDASIVIGQPDFITRDSAGACAPATSLSLLCEPVGIAFDPSGNLWVSDTGGDRVLEFAQPFQDGESASLVVGTGSCPSTATSSSLCGPWGIAFDSSGNLWVADTYDWRVLEFPPPFTAGASVVLGQADFASSSSQGATQTSVGQPQDLAFDASGNLWVADNYDNRILEFVPSSSSTTSSTTTASTSASSTTLTTTTLVSCAGNSAGNGIFGVCVEPSSINVGGTVAVTGTAFISGSTYVLNVTEPDGARFGTEAYSYSCSTAPCSTPATFPTDFSFQIPVSGVPAESASTSQPGTYYASVCSYSVPHDCATTTFSVASTTTTTTTASTGSTATAPLSDQVQASDSVSPPPSPLSDLLHVMDAMPPPPMPLTDTIGVSDAVASSILRTITASLNDAINVADSFGQGAQATLTDSLGVADSVRASLVRTIVVSLNDAVTMADSLGQGAQTALTDGVGIADQVGKSANVLLTDLVQAVDSQSSTVMLPKLTFTMGSAAPANVLVSDPQGREVGCTSAGVMVNQVPAATVSGCGAHNEIITIPNAVAGSYSIRINGTAASSTKGKGSHFTVVVSSYSLSGNALYSLPLKGDLTPTTSETAYVTVSPDGQLTQTKVVAGTVAGASIAVSGIGLLALGVVRSRARGVRKRPKTG